MSWFQPRGRSGGFVATHSCTYFPLLQGFENQELRYFTAGKGLVKVLPSYRRRLQPFREDIHFRKNTNFLFMG
jgi:hypothetical protein